jgi:hypothetical protein
MATTGRCDARIFLVVLKVIAPEVDGFADCRRLADDGHVSTSATSDGFVCYRLSAPVGDRRSPRFRPRVHRLVSRSGCRVDEPNWRSHNQTTARIPGSVSASGVRKVAICDN